MPEAVKGLSRAGGFGLRANLVVLALLLAAAGWIYWPAIDAVLRSWEFDYDHGPVLFLISLYLFYRCWPRIAAMGRGPAWLGVAGLLLASGAWALAFVASIQSVEMLLLPVIVAGIFLCMLGWRSLLAASLPIAYLYFAMPVWGFLNPLLQALTVVATSHIMAVISIPARISGNFVILPNGVFEIASGCSGLSYFISAGAIGVLYAGLYLRGLQRRLLMVLGSLLLAVVANWVRVVLIIVAGYQTDMQHYLVAVDHYWFGWAIFGVFLVPLFWLGRKLEDQPLPASADDKSGSSEAAEASHPAIQTNPATAGLLLVAALGAMTAAPLAAGAFGATADDQVVTADREQLARLRLPPEITGWKSAAVLSGAWWPVFQNVQFSDSRSYLRDRLEVEAHWLVYLDQRQDAEAVNAYNFYAERATWRQQETWPTVVTDGAGTDIPVTGALITAAGVGRKKLAVTYYVAGELAASGIDAKLAQVKGLMRGRRDAGVLLLGVNCEDDCPDATAALHDLLATLMPLLQAQLDAVAIESKSARL